jgi:hypothetical protein
MAWRPGIGRRHSVVGSKQRGAAADVVLSAGNVGVREFRAAPRAGHALRWKVMWVTPLGAETASMS